MVRPLGFLPPLLFAAMAGLFVGGMWRDRPDELPSTRVGQAAPTLPDAALPGQEVLTREMLTDGEVTVVNFWASWCPPCRAEHPVLMQMAADGVRVAGINFRDEADAGTDYLSDFGDPFFAGGFDPSGRVSIEWGVTAPPETFIVDGDGTVLLRFTGPLLGTDYERRFVPALREAMGG